MRRTLTLLLVLVTSLLVAACAATQPLLNSERIEKKYGSYGVEVLSQEGRHRESNLYSGTAEDHTMRTYAIVNFVDPENPAFADVHAAIIAGGSIGTTFKDAGWKVDKEIMNTSVLTIPAGSEEIGDLMRIDLPAELASMTYHLVVFKDGQSYNYARITELYHPDYLGIDDLPHPPGN